MATEILVLSRLQKKHKSNVNNEASYNVRVKLRRLNPMLESIVYRLLDCFKFLCMAWPCNESCFIISLKMFFIFWGLIFMLSVQVYLIFTVLLYTKTVKMTSAFSPYSDLCIEFDDNNDSPGEAKVYMVAYFICKVLFWR